MNNKYRILHITELKLIDLNKLIQDHETSHLNKAKITIIINNNQQCNKNYV